MTEHSYEMLKRMGCIIEYPVFYDKLTAKENLILHGEYMGYYDPQAIGEALELVKLTGVDKSRIEAIFTWDEATSGYCQSLHDET